MVEFLWGLQAVHYFVYICERDALLSAKIQQGLIFLFFAQNLLHLGFFGGGRVYFFHLEVSWVVWVLQLIVELRVGHITWAIILSNTHRVSAPRRGLKLALYVRPTYPLNTLLFETKLWNFIPSVDSWKLRKQVSLHNFLKHNIACICRSFNKRLRLHLFE